MNRDIKKGYKTKQTSKASSKDVHSDCHVDWSDLRGTRMDDVKDLWTVVQRHSNHDAIANPQTSNMKCVLSDSNSIICPIDGQEEHSEKQQQPQ